MANVFDVAKYVLELHGEMTAMKLEKLVYYCQAWSLVWDERPLFPEQIEAWANGPVIPDLYNFHKGLYRVRVTDISGNSENLDQKAKETVQAVIQYYGDKSSQWLSDLTHMEDPWKLARSGLNPGERGNRVITHASMADYYSSIES